MQYTLGKPKRKAKNQYFLIEEKTVPKIVRAKLPLSTLWPNGLNKNPF